MGKEYQFNTSTDAIVTDYKSNVRVRDDLNSLTEHKNFINLRLFKTSTNTITPDCRRSKLGWEYRGSRDRTFSGIPCQRWDQQYPRTHTYQSLSGEQNFCRNPARAYAEEPWCYTTAGNKAWDYCFVPMCGLYQLIFPYKN